MPRGKPTTTYEVTGAQAVLGRSKGDTLTSEDFDNADQEARLLDSGAIAPVDRAAPSPTPQPSAPPNPTPAPAPDAGAEKKE
jgi:hypothetical protein